MTRRVKCIIAVVLAFQLLVPVPIWAAAVGQFISVAGEVTQTTAGVVVRPVEKSPIQAKDLIVTGERSAASLVFDDESTISLSENAKLEVEEFTIRDNVRRGLFSLAIGRLVADVRKFVGGDSRFEVRSPTAVAGVRGTGFALAVAMVGGQMTTTVTCTVGSLSVSALSTTGAVVATTTIVAGQTAVVTATGITVSAAAAGTAGASAAGAGGSGTAGGAGAAGGTGAAAGAAGAAAGATAAAGIGAGTIAIGAAVAAGAAAAAVGAAGGGGGSTTPATTATHH